MKSTNINGHVVTFLGYLDYTNGEILSIDGMVYIVVDDPTDDEDRYEYGGPDRVLIFRGKLSADPDVTYLFFSSHEEYDIDADGEAIDYISPAKTVIKGNDAFFNNEDVLTQLNVFMQSISE